MLAKPRLPLALPAHPPNPPPIRPPGRPLAATAAAALEDNFTGAPPPTRPHEGKRGRRIAPRAPPSLSRRPLPHRDSPFSPPSTPCLPPPPPPAPPPPHPPPRAAAITRLIHICGAEPRAPVSRARLDALRIRHPADRPACLRCRACGSRFGGALKSGNFGGEESRKGTRKCLAGSPPWRRNGPPEQSAYLARSLVPRPAALTPWQNAATIFRSRAHTTQRMAARLWPAHPHQLASASTHAR